MDGCVYISTFEANLDFKLNSLKLDANILFFLWALDSYEMKHQIWFLNRRGVS